jgi:hypothetical protein
MQLWPKSKESNAARGGDFEEAAARVTVAAGESPADAAMAGVESGDRLDIRPEWAQAAARLCFLPAARLSHPAYALTDEEADSITPQIQALMQAVADKYAPALVGRVASRHPELFDAIAALGVLYWQKWRLVSRLQREEALLREARMGAEAQQPKERAEADAFAAAAVASGTLPGTGGAPSVEAGTTRQANTGGGIRVI